MVEVKRKNGESPESLLRRFSRKVQQSGVLLQAKKKKFYYSPKSKKELKESAKRKKMLSEQRDYLKKIGKWNELIGKKFKLSKFLKK